LLDKPILLKKVSLVLKYLYLHEARRSLSDKKLKIIMDYKPPGPCL